MWVCTKCIKIDKRNNIKKIKRTSFCGLPSLSFTRQTIAPGKKSNSSFARRVSNKKERSHRRRQIQSNAVARLRPEATRFSIRDVRQNDTDRSIPVASRCRLSIGFVITPVRKINRIFFYILACFERVA